MGTILMRAMLLTTASVAMLATAAPTVVHAQEATYQIDIPAQSMGDALRALGKATKQNIVFNGSILKGKRSAAVRGRMTVGDALAQMIAGSGLKMGHGSGGGFTVQAGNGGGIPASVPQRPSVKQRQGRGTVTGTVTDETSGAALKGALVELVGTGRTTSTDDLGVFNFVNVPVGDQTIRISYLGYIGQQSSFAVGAGETYAQNFTLTGGSGGQEIVVYGSRSARAQALNQERTADNVASIISSDLLGDFTGTTLSESLRRVPGVAFQRDANTGAGTNIIIRGLDADLNAVKLNGVELPEGSGLGRSASLGNILTESISSVTINKTLLADGDSAGTGGLVEIETKSPLDRPRRFFSVIAEGATKSKSFGSDFLIAGTASAKFGSDNNLGIGASVQYREAEISKAAYSLGLAFGQYLPLQVDGRPTVTSVLGVDPRRHFPFEDGEIDVYPNRVSLNLDESKTRVFNASISAAASLGSTELRLDFTHLAQSDDILTRQTVIQGFTSYTLRPVLALGGEPRRALGWVRAGGESLYLYQPDQKTISNVASFRGKTTLGRLELDYSAGVTKGSRSAPTNQLIVNMNDPSFNSSFVLPNAVDPIEGRILSIFAEREGRGFPLPLLTDAGFRSYANPASYAFGSAARSGAHGSNSRWLGSFTAKYKPNWKIVEYISAGVEFEKSRYQSSREDIIQFDGVTDSSGALPSLEELGIRFSDEDLSKIGISNYLGLISQNDFINFVENGIDDISAIYDPNNPATYSRPALVYRSTIGVDPRTRSSHTDEAELAAFVQAKIKFGNFDVIAGTRLSSVRVSAVNLNSPEIFNVNNVRDTQFREENTKLVSERASQLSILPRFLVNYRRSDNLIARFGYFQTIARPQIGLISRSSSVILRQRPAFGPQLLPQLAVTRGNPDLAPARTHNFDLSLEHYDGTVGVLKLGAFYKRITNLLESNLTTGPGALSDVTLPDDPRFADVLANPDDYHILVTNPINNPSVAKIWGVEASIEKQLTWLPGWLSGLGVYANYTYTQSKKDAPVTFSLSPVVDQAGNVIRTESLSVIIPDVRFNNQPRHTGTFGITYNKYGFDANVAYTWQARRQTQFAIHNLSRFEEAFNTLDARLSYRWKAGRADLEAFFEGADLLRGSSDASLSATIGAGDAQTPKYHVGGSYFGGRQIRAGLRVSF